PDMMQNAKTVCAGDAVTFTAIGYNADTIQYSWTFPGGNPGTSTVSNPTVTYSTPGVYNVVLQAISSGGSNTKTFNNVVTVYNATGAFTGIYQNNFEATNSFPDTTYTGY